MCCGGLTNVSLFHKTHPSPVSWRTHKEELTWIPLGCRASNTFEVARMQSGRAGWLFCLDKRSKCLLWKSFLSWIFALFIQPIIMMTLMFSKVWDLHFSASACAVKFYWSEAPQYSDSSALWSPAMPLPSVCQCLWLGAVISLGWDWATCRSILEHDTEPQSSSWCW